MMPSDTDNGMTGDTDNGMTGGTDNGMTGDTDNGMTGDTDNGMTGDTDNGMTGDTDNGMTGGTEPPVHTPTLAEVYSSDSAPDQPFSVVSASVRRNYTADTTSVPNDMKLSVSLVRRNTGGGYDITYLIDGMERTVRFLPEHCDEVAEECQVPGHTFWAMFRPGRGWRSVGSNTPSWNIFLLGTSSPMARPVTDRTSNSARCSCSVWRRRWALFQPRE